MIPSSSASSSGLTWSKLPRNGGYEVRLNSTVVGKLRQTSFWSSNYEATTSAGTFTFRRNGCWGTKAEIVDSASQRQIASFESAWRRRSKLTFADGQEYYIDRRGCWQPQWSVIMASGQPVLSLDLKQRTGNAPSSIDVKDSRLALLIMFILYRIRQAEEDASVAAVVAAISPSFS